MKEKIFFLTFIVLLCACSNQKPQSQEITPAAEEEPQSALFAYPLPTSMEITQTLETLQIPYLGNLTNNPDNVYQYVSTREKALNLGVYTADICYSLSYNMRQEALSHLKAATKLLDELGITSPFSEQIVNSFKDDNVNKDSILIVVNDSFKDTYSYLRKNKMEHINLLVITGSFVEGLYILTQIASPDKENILKTIAGQKNLLNEILKLYEPVKDMDILKEPYEQLLHLQEDFSAIKFTVDAMQLETIKKSTASLRKNII